MNTTHQVYLLKRSRKLPSGKQASYYALKWFNTEGKPIEESIGRIGARTRDGEKITQKYAEQRRREKELAIGSGRIKADKAKSMTLTAFLDLDREAIAGDVRGSTLREHNHAKQHAIAALGADADVTKLTYADAARIKQRLVDLGRAPATVRKTLITLRAAWNRSIEAGIVHTNPFAKLRLPRVESKAKRIFTTAEVEAMIQAAPSLWWRAFIRLAVTSGLRRAELLNLHWRDIDFDAGTVQVSPKQSETFEHKGQTYRTWQWSAKAKASYRTVPLPDEAVKLLRRLRVKQGGSPFVFIDLRRIGQLQPHIDASGKLPAAYEVRRNMIRDFHVIQRHAAERLQKATPGGKYEWRIGCLHDLRRTFCTIMANHVPMHILKQWAGHADISTTASFYLGMTDGMTERAKAAWSAAG
jgi:integrase